MNEQDEALLQPSRELLAKIGQEIATLESETKAKIDRYGKDDPEYAKEIWHQFGRAVELLRLEQERVLKTIVDYYAAQPPAPQIVTLGTSPSGIAPFDADWNAAAAAVRKDAGLE